MGVQFNRLRIRRPATEQEIRTVERVQFLKSHPELTPHLHQLLGAVASCPEATNLSPEWNLGRVYAHYETCDRCRADFEDQKLLQTSLDAANARKYSS